MKNSGTCPKCSSTDIIADAKAIDRGDGNVQRELSIATFGNPNALIFKDQSTTTVSAWVCAECGYVELYADRPGDIRRAGGG